MEDLYKSAAAAKAAAGICHAAQRQIPSMSATLRLVQRHPHCPTLP